MTSKTTVTRTLRQVAKDVTTVMTPRIGRLTGRQKRG